jgi:hypothetical protein
MLGRRSAPSVVEGTGAAKARRPIRRPVAGVNEADRDEEARPQVPQRAQRARGVLGIPSPAGPFHASLPIMER